MPSIGIEPATLRSLAMVLSFSRTINIVYFYLKQSPFPIQIDLFKNRFYKLMLQKLLLKLSLQTVRRAKSNYEQ